MKLLIITVQIPWGKSEAFLLEEFKAIKRNKVDLLIIPRNPINEIYHKEAEKFLNDSIFLPLLDLKMLINFIKCLLKDKNIRTLAMKIAKSSRSLSILIKNIIVLPKACYVGKMIHKKDIDFIYVHWGATTATMGYVISEITGIPWGMTLHRGDIKENNMLKEKVESAKFVRCISEHGKNELTDMVGKGFEKKINVIYMGVEVFEKASQIKLRRDLFMIIVPANLFEVKGHRYLIDACLMLVRKNIENFKCIFYGKGVMKRNLTRLIIKGLLTNYIKIQDAIPHEELMELYKSGRVGVVVLPSIVTKSGEHEGIPVALMEAMANGVPVVSTNTGGISELLSGNAGIIVNEKSPKELCEAIKRIMTEETLYRELQSNGLKKIKEGFSTEKNMDVLLKLIKENT